jgi:hypothetical protein
LRDDLNYLEIVAELKKRSLITASGDSETVYLHKLTQSAIRGYLASEGDASAGQLAQAAIHPILGISHEGPCPNTLGNGAVVHDPELEHYIAVANNTAQVEDLEVGAADLFYHLGKAFEAMGDPNLRSQAPPLLLRALGIFTKKLGADDPRVLAVLTNLGIAYVRLGRCKEGRGYLRRAIDLARKTDLVAAGTNFRDLPLTLQDYYSRACEFCEHDLR